MGLDMWLTKKYYIWQIDRVNKIVPLSRVIGGNVKLDEMETDFDSSEIKIDLSTLKELSFDCVYWRKSNHIHKWFVDNVQGGVDNCEEYYVDIDKLKELLHICKEVKEDHSKANDLLPTQSGFFFGDTDYNKWYYEDIEYTIGMLEKIFNDPNADEYEYFYRSSW